MSDRLLTDAELASINADFLYTGKGKWDKRICEAQDAKSYAASREDTAREIFKKLAGYHNFNDKEWESLKRKYLKGKTK